LRGARGNSGTILSMLLRGFANALNNSDYMDAPKFVQACRSAVDYTYATVSSMMKPVEGTILTVARVSTEQLEAHVSADATLTEAFDLLVKYAKEALDNTPNQLPTLPKVSRCNFTLYCLKKQKPPHGKRHSSQKMNRATAMMCNS
jgi:uncharacterized protein